MSWSPRSIGAYHHGVTTSSADNLRVSDSEREAAVRVLGEHMTAGRLDVEEYGQRSAHVTAARTRGEIAEQFADLPAPRPSFGTPIGQPATNQTERSRTRSLAQRFPVVPVLAIGLVIAVVVLAVTTKTFFLFALFPILMMVKRTNQRGR